MDTYKLEHDVKIFGMQVDSFPAGIQQAFESLANKISKGNERAYYGISYFNSEGIIIYNAAAAEEQEGEAEKYQCERYIIEKGQYLTTVVNNWRNKTASIKDIFNKLMQDSRIDKASPCIEWYKTDDEMLCMIRIINPG